MARMRYYVWTVGCQMNVADSERMEKALSGMGGLPARDWDDADIVVLNTCSVRQAAENRAFGKLFALRATKLKRQDLIVVLAGCMVGDDSLAELQRRLPFVDSFIRPGDVDGLRETVRALAPNGSLMLPVDGTSGALSPNGRASSDEEAAGPVRWVPVIYGCDRSCSYCIVPARRGREHSRPPAEVEAEVREMVATGAREVRLLGQIVDRYGWDLAEKTDLGNLFFRLGKIEGLERIRFLTSHPGDLKDPVIDAMAGEPKVCEDLNIPIQSGDDEILKSMRRGYTASAYLKLIERLRARMPDIALSTDVIVGYPGETDAQFGRTLDLLRALSFDVVHVAMYSPRPGTLAAALTDNIPQAEKKERLQRVEHLQVKVAEARNRLLAGRSVEVLVEGKQKGKWAGRTRGNKPVFFAHGGDWKGRLVQVCIDRAGPWSLSGTLVTEVGRP